MGGATAGCALAGASAAVRSRTTHWWPWMEPSLPWYPDQIQIDLLVANALLRAGRLDEAIALRGNRLELAGHGFALDRRGRLLCDSVHGPAPRPYGIDALLAGTIPARAIRGKVVVLGYLRSDSPRLTVAGRELPIHELFYRQVACLARRVTGD